MFQLVRSYEPIADVSGLEYQPRAYGDLQPDGSWDGWLVFFPLAGGVVIATDRETTQHSLPSLVRWASTITPVYLEGALERALRLRLEPTFSARLAELALLDRREAEDAAALEAAAARARTDAELALLDRRAAEDAAALESAAERARADAEMAETDAAMHEAAAAAQRAEARERTEDARALEDELAERPGASVERSLEATGDLGTRSHAADTRRPAGKKSRSAKGKKSR